MAWDANRPVPWQRLAREWLIYVAIMAVVFLAFFRERNLVGILGGLLASGPIFLAFGYAMAKLGYQRKSLKDLRNEPRPAKAKKRTNAEEVLDAPRARPAPTKRTGGGTRPNRSGKRRR